MLLCFNSPLVWKFNRFLCYFYWIYRLYFDPKWWIEHARTLAVWSVDQHLSLINSYLTWVCMRAFFLKKKEEKKWDANDVVTLKSIRLTFAVAFRKMRLAYNAHMLPGSAYVSVSFHSVWELRAFTILKFVQISPF